MNQNQNLKVAIIAPFDLKKIYGNTLRPIQEAKGLLANKFKCFAVFCLEKNPAFKFRQIKISKGPFCWLPDFLRKKDINYLYDFLFSKKIRLEKLPPVIHLHNYYSISVIPSSYQGKIITDWHGFKSLDLKNKCRRYLSFNPKNLLYSLIIIPFVEKLERKSLQRADKIIAAAANIQKDINKIFPQYKNKVIVINNPVIPQNFLLNKHQNKFNVGAIGPFSHENNKVIKTIISIAQKIPEIEFKLAGELEKKTKKEVEKIRNIKVLGWISEKQYRLFLSRIGVLLLPYFGPKKFGGTRNKLIQAAASGTPIISTIDGARGFKEKKYLYLADTRKQIEQFIRKLGRNIDLRKKTGENLKRAVFKNYHYKIEARKLIDLYKELEQNSKKKR